MRADVRWERPRRWAFFAVTVGSAGVGVWMMARILAGGGMTALETLVLALFAPTFLWIVLPFWTAVAGLVLHLTGRDPLTLERRASAKEDTADGTTAGPTALVMPIYNEDPAGVEARLSAMARGLMERGVGDAFHVHILSDSTRPEVAREEEAAWARLQGMHPELRFFYRRRERNEGRKAGNIAEFCTRCGDDYPFMVVLDADSLMTAETLVELVRRMAANPGLALLQTVPLPIRQETLLGRFIQFAAWSYTPLLALGQAFWQGSAANYWGHNAILRTAPFRDEARLPVLPGRAPLGGEVLSHDFVEAALLRRAGWDVVLDPLLGGSYEELPANLVDYGRRDRRWAQGSLQHLRLLGMPGLHRVNRLHFAMGAMGYVSSLLWFLILLAGSAYVYFPSLRTPGLELGMAGGALPVSLLGVTAVVLFLPKLLGLAVALGGARRFGGALRLLVSAALETVFSVLLAPVLMILHSRFVVEILLGRDVGWGAQTRDAVDLPWGDALRVGAGPALLGLVWTGLTLWWSPGFVVWMSPILVGLLLTPVLVAWTSRPAWGLGLRRLGLLQAPCEAAPSAEVTAVTRTLGDLPGIRGVQPFSQELDMDAGAEIGMTMYNAERALFDLRRGRAVLVRDPDGTHALVASVEGLGAPELRELEDWSDAAPRLVVTRHRAEAMGLAPGSGDGSGAGPDIAGPDADYCVTLCLDRGVGLETVLQLSAGRTGPWAGSPPTACPNVRAEAAGLRLAHLGQLLPALVAVPVVEPLTEALAGALAQGRVLQVETPEVEAFVETSKTDVVRVSDAPVPLSESEDSRFVLFREACGLGEHVAILVGSEESWPDPVPVRLHSACLTGDLFGSLRCDCGEQLRGSMEYFASQGGGVLLYLAQEGRGIGLGNKFRAYTLQETGLDTIDADGTLGFGADERRYDVAVKILAELGVRRIELLTNNPEKVEAVEAAGLKVVRRQPLHGRLNRHNLPYVRAKVDRAGHWLHSMLNQGVAGD